MSTTEKSYCKGKYITNPRSDKGMRGGYCYRKTSHPRNAEEPQGYEETELSDTLNIYDISEARIATLIVEVKSGRKNNSG